MLLIAEEVRTAAEVIAEGRNPSLIPQQRIEFEFRLEQQFQLIRFILVVQQLLVFDLIVQQQLDQR